MLRTDTAVTIYRKDYTAPAFRIDEVALEIDLAPERCEVRDHAPQGVSTSQWADPRALWDASWGETTFEVPFRPHPIRPWCPLVVGFLFDIRFPLSPRASALGWSANIEH